MRILLALLLVSSLCRAGDDAIEGVQPAAMDQPRIFVCLRREARGAVLQTQGKDVRSGIEAFLDTGASGVVLSSDTCGQLGIGIEKTPDGKDVTYDDVGVGGSEKFTVSQPLFFALAPYPNGDDPTNFDKPFGPIRAQIRAESGIDDIVSFNVKSRRGVRVRRERT